MSSNRKNKREVIHALRTVIDFCRNILDDETDDLRDLIFFKTSSFTKLNNDQIINGGSPDEKDAKKIVIMLLKKHTTLGATQIMREFGDKRSNFYRVEKLHNMRMKYPESYEDYITLFNKIDQEIQKIK